MDQVKEYYKFMFYTLENYISMYSFAKNFMLRTQIYNIQTFIYVFKNN